MQLIPHTPPWDHAHRDPRSVHASLHGRDDGRTRCYEKIFRRMHIPGESFLEIDLIFKVGDFMDAELPRMQARRAWVKRQLNETLQEVRTGLRVLLIALAGWFLALGSFAMLKQ